jgi:hypothetical protein
MIGIHHHHDHHQTGVGVFRSRINRITGTQTWYFAFYDGDRPHFHAVTADTVTRLAACGSALTAAHILAQHTT